MTVFRFTPRCFAFCPADGPPKYYDEGRDAVWARYCAFGKLFGAHLDAVGQQVRQGVSTETTLPTGDVQGYEDVVLAHVFNLRP